MGYGIVCCVWVARYCKGGDTWKLHSEIGGLKAIVELEREGGDNRKARQKAGRSIRIAFTMRNKYLFSEECHIQGPHKVEYQNIDLIDR